MERIKLDAQTLLGKQSDISGFGSDDLLGVFKQFEEGGLKQYYRSWNDEKELTEVEEAELAAELGKKYKILYADYTYADYSGDAYVLGYDFVEGKFFEVHGSHCSCYGLEGQWGEEYCTIEELEELVNRRFESVDNNREWYYYRNADSSDEFKAWLQQ